MWRDGSWRKGRRDRRQGLGHLHVGWWLAELVTAPRLGPLVHRKLEREGIEKQDVDVDRGQVVRSNGQDDDAAGPSRVAG